jgi:hypothetical protein
MTERDDTEAQRRCVESSVAKELRTLASEIEKICKEAPCVSVAFPVVRNCVDHLTALAAVYEKTMQLAELEREQKAAIGQ